MRDPITLLVSDLQDTRKRTLELVKGLDENQLIGPKLATVNPLLWEIAHVAYFHEFWTLRHDDGADSFLSNADQLFDSINVAHDDRWDLPLPNLQQTLAYMQQVLDAEILRLQRQDVTQQDIYLTQYAIFHEDMHTEAFTYSRQTLDYPAPAFANARDHSSQEGSLDGDVAIPGGMLKLGANQNTKFCFDNEKWAHDVEVLPFSIAKAATNYSQFAEFVDADGYQDQQYWDEASWAWLQKSGIKSPLYWRKNGQGQWLIKHFDQWQAMRPNAAVIHVSWYEAKAWCRWAERRLPTEAEWEMAASGSGVNEPRTAFPWGDQAADFSLANLDGRALQTIDVAALPAGDSVYGCRQMIGNVWEWTADTFLPFAGFEADMYADYSQPLFGITKVLKGGAWTTRSRMIRSAWRNYYGPERNDVFAGFRSCC